MFPKYHPFNEAFKARYPLLFGRYSYAAMVLDKELRNVMAGDDLFMRENVGKLARRNPINAALLEMSLVGRPADGPSYYLKLGTFDALSDAIGKELMRRGLVSFSDQKVLGFSRNRQLHALTVRGRQFKRAWRYGLSHGME